MISGSGDKTVRLWDAFPDSQRVLARRELQAIRPEAERWVESLAKENPDPTRVIELIRSDAKSSALMKRAAWHALVRRVQKNKLQKTP